MKHLPVLSPESGHYRYLCRLHPRGTYTHRGRHLASLHLNDRQKVLVDARTDFHFGLRVHLKRTAVKCLQNIQRVRYLKILCSLPCVDFYLCFFLKVAITGIFAISITATGTRAFKQTYTHLRRHLGLQLTDRSSW